MNLPQRYILLLGPQASDTQDVEDLLEHLQCSVAIAHSAQQALAQVRQSSPYLLIFASQQEDWSQPFINQLRDLARTGKSTLIALTECHAPHWLRQEDNPGFDGFLVKPLSPDILRSLVHSARLRQALNSVG